MATKLREKTAGEKFTDAAKDVGNTIAQGAERAVDFVKEKTGMNRTGPDVGPAGIRENMDVIASCGKKVGVVDRVEGESIKLTKNDSPDGQHHFIPTNWVDHVDDRVHLNKNSMVTEQNWQSEEKTCGCDA